MNRLFFALVPFLVVPAYAYGEPTIPKREKLKGPPAVRDGMRDQRWGEPMKWLTGLLRDDTPTCQELLKPMFEGGECRSLNTRVDFTTSRALMLECLIDKDDVIACAERWEYARRKDASDAIAQLRKQLGPPTSRCTAELGGTNGSECWRWEQEPSVRVLMYVPRNEKDESSHDSILFIQGASSRAKQKKAGGE